MTEVKIGDNVKFRLLGRHTSQPEQPIMVVNSIGLKANGHGGSAECLWFDTRNRICHAWLKMELLVVVE